MLKKLFRKSLDQKYFFLQKINTLQLRLAFGLPFSKRYGKLI